MKKTIRRICSVFILFTAVIMSFVVYGFYSLPDEIYSYSDKEVDLGFYTCSLPEEQASVSKNMTVEGEYRLDISLFKAVPVKSSSLTVSSRQYVVASGDIVGLRMFTRGVMLVGIDTVDTQNGSISPAEKAQLKKGDVIISLDGQEIKNSAQVESIIASCNGRALEIEFTRKSKQMKSVIIPLYCLSEGKYKTGMWIRDSAAGIGTMTFYKKDTRFFGCLGHAVCDVDTGEVLPLSDGDIVGAEITGCVKGRTGCAGELCGSFESSRQGVLTVNGETGAYGYLENTSDSEKEIPVALGNEVQEGPAEIISTVEGSSKARYEIVIEKIISDDKDGKNMVIKITDSELINKTGGIVQGMSGSPIIQNGKLIGAVTHVFLNDPTKGYGIFAESMLKTEKQAADGYEQYREAG